jgi:hypothetical protein
MFSHDLDKCFKIESLFLLSVAEAIVVIFDLL